MPDKKNITVCMLSCQHSALDDRIYMKEARALSQHGYNVVHIAYGDTAQDYYTADNVRIIQLKRKKKSRSLKSKIAAFRQLWLRDMLQAATSVSAHIYHLHDVELCRIARRLQKLPSRPQVIYDAHEPYPENLKDYWRERSLLKVLFNDLPAVFAEKRVLKKMNYLIATEENVASRFRRQNPNTSIVYNYSYFHPGTTDTDGRKEFDAVYCGTVSESKGIFQMLDAVVAAKKMGYELKLAVVGQTHNPDLQRRIEGYIEKEKLRENVFLAGSLPLEEVSTYYEKSKTGLCLFPSNRTNRLILPIKLFEYAAFRLPVIGSAFGHIHDFIQSNGVGISVDPHNPQEVASALIRMTTGDRYKEYRQVCADCVRDKYLWEDEKKQLLAVYDKLIKNGAE